MTDCIVVGGGLIGMLSARELKKAGFNVLLLEKGQPGKESSWAGGGILSPLHPWQYPDVVNELASTGHKAYEALAEELLEQSSIDPQYYRCGMLVLHSAEQQAERLSAAQSWAEKWSMNLSAINTHNELSAIAPGLSARCEQGLWMPDIAQLRNPRFVKSLHASLDTLGIAYKENTPVEKLTVANGVINGVRANGKHYSSDHVLVAGGAWSAQILSACQQPAPDIHPVKGQMILFKGRPGQLKTILLAENRYLIPRKDGRILCGSTIEQSGFDKSISSDVKQELLQSAVALFPQLQTLAIEHHWSGLRPGSPQGVPYIGRHGDIKGLYINAGHFRNGVILGLGSAQRISAMIASDAGIG